MKRAMVFIDFDNLAIDLRPHSKMLDFDVLVDIVKRTAETEYKDKCLVWGNCYRNYDRNTPPGGIMFEAHKRGIVPIYVPSYPAGPDRPKSLCDPMLICDAMDALYNNQSIDVFVLVSSDKDFVPLIRKIAENGKEIMVVGMETYARTLIEECNRLGFPFFDYRQLAEGFKTKEEVA